MEQVNCTVLNWANYKTFGSRCHNLTKFLINNLTINLQISYPINKTNLHLIQFAAIQLNL